MPSEDRDTTAPQPAPEQTLGSVEPPSTPALGVDWGSNIDPGPGPDPRVIPRDARAAGRSMAV
jgi:hypothetical protein